MYSFSNKIIKEKKLAENMEKIVGKSLQRIFDDITASHAKTASRNDFENDLKKYFNYIYSFQRH